MDVSPLRLGAAALAVPVVEVAVGVAAAVPAVIKEPRELNIDARPPAVAPVDPGVAAAAPFAMEAICKSMFMAPPGDESALAAVLAAPGTEPIEPAGVATRYGSITARNVFMPDTMPIKSLSAGTRLSNRWMEVSMVAAVMGASCMLLTTAGTNADAGNH